jgi:hypothetical protein
LSFDIKASRHAVFGLLVLSVLSVLGSSSKTRSSRSTTSRFQAQPKTALEKRACGETNARVCYGVGGGEAQNIDIADIAYAASYLRYLADNNNNPLWTMPPEFDCSKWGLPIADAGIVLVLAKHIKPRTNSSVTYYDLACTIDGGVETTPAQLSASFLGAWRSGGGMMGVTVDDKDPAYSTPAYKASGAKHEDLIIKVVRAPAA